MRITTLAHLRRAPVALALLVAPTLAAQGLTYDVRTSATMSDPRSGAQTTRTFMAAHGQFANGVSRLDVTESLTPAGGMMSAGTYMITNAATGTTTMVDPAKRQYVEMNPAELAKTSAGLQQSLGGIAKMDVSNVAVHVDDLGAGETIEGFATLKYRITESYTMNMSVMGRTTSTAQTSTTDLWVAPQLDGAMNPTARPASGAATGPMAELTAQVTAAYTKVRKGVMLKRITTSESNANGKTRSTTLTMTLSNVKRGAISAGTFQVPSDYTKVASPLEALSPLGVAGESLDAARARSRGTHAATDSIDPAAQAKKALGKLFGRPRE